MPKFLYASNRTAMESNNSKSPLAFAGLTRSNWYQMFIATSEAQNNREHTQQRSKTK
jgi:hypothetical protein